MNAPCLFLQRLGVDDLDTAPTKVGRRISERTLGHYVPMVAAAHRLNPTDVTSRSYVPAHIHARQDLMWRLRRLGYSYPEIGLALDGRDHNTIQIGCREHAKRCGLPHDTPKRAAA